MMSVTAVVLEKDKMELQEKLSKADKERVIFTHREADLTKKVRLCRTRYASSIYTVGQKTAPLHFCNNFVKAFCVK